MTATEHSSATPTCSRCLKPLVVTRKEQAITGPFWGSSLAIGTEVAPVVHHTYHCPDHCASVAERWRLAFERSASGWAEYKHQCSRCGTNLMGPPPEMEFYTELRRGTLQPIGYFCPGCGPLDEKELLWNWRGAVSCQFCLPPKLLRSAKRKMALADRVSGITRATEGAHA